MSATVARMPEERQPTIPPADPDHQFHWSHIAFWILAPVMATFQGTQPNRKR